MKLDKCFWYLLDYVCEDGQWTYAEMVPRKMLITNLDGTKSPINQVKVTESKKTLGIHDSPSGGNAAHLSSIKAKVSIWVNRMTNGHHPNHTAWIAYKHQLWPGVGYGLGMMTNDLKVADSLLHDEEYRTLNVRHGPQRHQRLALPAYDIRRIWPVQPASLAINMPSKYAHAALSCLHQFEQETQCISKISPASIGHAPQSTFA